MNRDVFTVIKRPRISEKADRLSEAGNVYTFEVDRDATKIEIRNAIEKYFKVRVDKVNTARVKGKIKRVGRNIGRTKDWKKAVVTLAEGHVIDIL